MMFSTAQEKIRLHQLVPANSNLNNATTNISFIFAVGIGRTSKIQDLRGVVIKSPGQCSSTPKHPFSHWHVQISLQSCEYSSYWDTKCNFELWNSLCHRCTPFLNAQHRARDKEGTGDWVLPIPRTGLISFWSRKSFSQQHLGHRDPDFSGSVKQCPLFHWTQATFTFKLTKWSTSVYFYIIHIFRRPKKTPQTPRTINS